MSLQKLFYMLKSAESEAADFYDRIRLDLSLKDPTMSDFFADLARDERLHEKQVVLVQSIFLNSKDAFLEKDGAEAQMEEYLLLFGKIRARYLREGGQLDTKALLKMARKLEEGLMERHRTFFMEVTDPGIQKLLGSLNLADEYHLKRITDRLPQ